LCRKDGKFKGKRWWRLGAKRDPKIKGRKNEKKFLGHLPKGRKKVKRNHKEAEKKKLQIHAEEGWYEGWKIESPAV